jgi:signal transduction histidine kinase
VDSHKKSGYPGVLPVRHGSRVMEVQALERRRVAIELHDELGQSLTAIKINLQLRCPWRTQAEAA